MVSRIPPPILGSVRCVLPGEVLLYRVCPRIGIVGAELRILVGCYPRTSVSAPDDMPLASVGLTPKG